MRYIVIVLLSMNSFYGISQKQIIENFSIDLKEIIKNVDVCKFWDLQTYPDSEMDINILNYIFGNENSDGFVKLFNKKNLMVSIFGPHLDPENDQSYFHIVYYNPVYVKKNKEGHLEFSGNRELLWGVNYIQTRIIVKDGTVKFYYPPFFYGTEYPW